MEGVEDLKLLGMWASPFALRVKLALSLKGLSYEYVEEDLVNKSELLLKSNPIHKKVPVLIHNGNKVVCESSVILQYIDEAFDGTGLSLLPSDPYERAIARFWAAYVDDKLLAAWSKSEYGQTEEERADGKEQSVVAVGNLEGALRECSKGKPFFGGDNAGFMDVMLGGVLGWARASEKLYGISPFDPSKTPLLAAWADNFGALETVEPVMPDVNKLVEAAKFMQAKLAAAAAGSDN